MPDDKREQNQRFCSCFAILPSQKAQKCLICAFSGGFYAGSEELLAGDGGDELLEVEGLEVGGVLEAAVVPGGEGGAEHRRSLRAALDEISIGMA